MANQNTPTPAEAAETVSSNELFWGHVTITCNMSSPGYPQYMISILDNSGKFRSNLGVTKEQFESAQFAQQNKFWVLTSSDGARPGTIIDMQVYS